MNATNVMCESERVFKMIVFKSTMIGMTLYLNAYIIYREFENQAQHRPNHLRIMMSLMYVLSRLVVAN